ncbi:MAG: ParB/RepB/Spo0J family partition protein [Actinobacteria bacterium]|nr:ParB/RepB/Spo0J family partition protein [Actinomycetota bacterium]
MARRGLGRGLSSLIPSFERIEAMRVSDIAVSKISPNPRQPRKDFNPELLEELIASINSFGVIQPIVVRPKDGGYELIAGERRWRAAQAAGLDVIPAIVRHTDDVESLELSIIENINRDDLNVVEEAYAFQQLIEDFGLTHADLSKKIGKSRSNITNILRIITLDTEIQEMLSNESITYGHARAILALEDKKLQKKIVKRTVDDQLSVRQVEEIVRNLTQRETGKKKVPKTIQPKKFPDIAQKLSDYFSVPVSVEMSKTRGKIEIEFGSIDDLERIFDLIIK